MGGGVAGGVRGSLADAVSTDFDVVFKLFDVFLYVGSGRRERFGDVVDAIDAGVAGGVGGFLGRSGDVTDLDIENFEIVFGMIDGVVVVVVVKMLFLFFFLLKRDFIVLTIFFV